MNVQVNSVQAKTDTLLLSAQESEVKSYCRQFPCVLAKSRGSEVWDTTGRRYLDFLAGAGSLNYGHNNPVIKAALVNYLESDSITHSLDIMTEAKEEFLNAFGTYLLSPRKLGYRVQFTGPTGTNAVEAAFKLARKVTGRTNIVGFTNGFHGVSMGSLAATGNRYLRNAASLPLIGTAVLPYDQYCGDKFDSLDYFEALLDDQSSGLDIPAAVVVETVQGEGGLKAASSAWLIRLQQLCNTRNILLIVDDIQAGCGRTGSFFSFEEAGLKPDLITLSKSISGYGLPMSLLLIGDSLDKWKPGEHNGTFRGNNHAFVTATATIKQFWTDDIFATEVREKAANLELRLQSLHSKFEDQIVEVRGRGLMRGLKCASEKHAEQITREAFQNGLIIERSGPRDEVIKLLMPLTTSAEQMEEGLNMLESAMESVFWSNATPPQVIPPDVIQPDVIHSTNSVRTRAI